MAPQPLITRGRLRSLPPTQLRRLAGLVSLQTRLERPEQHSFDRLSGKVNWRQGPTRRDLLLLTEATLLERLKPARTDGYGLYGLYSTDPPLDGGQHGPREQSGADSAELNEATFLTRLREFVGPPEQTLLSEQTAQHGRRAWLAGDDLGGVRERLVERHGLWTLPVSLGQDLELAGLQDGQALHGTHRYFQQEQVLVRDTAPPFKFEWQDQVVFAERAEQHGLREVVRSEQFSVDDQPLGLHGNLRPSARDSFTDALNESARVNGLKTLLRTEDPAQLTEQTQLHGLWQSLLRQELLTLEERTGLIGLRSLLQRDDPVTLATEQSKLRAVQQLRQADGFLLNTEQTGGHRTLLRADQAVLGDQGTRGVFFRNEVQAELISFQEAAGRFAIRELPVQREGLLFTERPEQHGTRTLEIQQDWFGPVQDDGLPHRYGDVERPIALSEQSSRHGTLALPVQSELIAFQDQLAPPGRPTGLTHQSDSDAGLMTDGSVLSRIFQPRTQDLIGLRDEQRYSDKLILRRDVMLLADLEQKGAYERDQSGADQFLLTDARGSVLRIHQLPAVQEQFQMADSYTERHGTWSLLITDQLHVQDSASPSAYVLSDAGLMDENVRMVNASPLRTDQSALAGEAFSRHGVLALSQQDRIRMAEQLPSPGRPVGRYHWRVNDQFGLNPEVSFLPREVKQIDFMDLLEVYTSSSKVQQDRVILYDGGEFVSFDQDDLVYLTERTQLMNNTPHDREQFALRELRLAVTDRRVKENYLLLEKRVLTRILPLQSDPFTLYEKGRMFSRSDYLDAEVMLTVERPGRTRSEAVLFRGSDAVMWAAWADPAGQIQLARRVPGRDTWRGRTRQTAGALPAGARHLAVMVDSLDRPLTAFELEGRVTLITAATQTSFPGLDPCFSQGRLCYLSPDRLELWSVDPETLTPLLTGALPRAGYLKQHYERGQESVLILDQNDRPLTDLTGPAPEYQQVLDEPASFRWHARRTQRVLIPIEGEVNDYYG